jgi:uncharacterized protein (TIGR03118 family)
MSRHPTTLAAVAALATATLAAAGPATAGPHRHHPGAAIVVRERKLVSDQPGVARVTDPHLVNAWGMSHGPNTPLWVSDNGADVSTLYSGATAPSAPPQVLPLTVSVPGGAPTGQVFNDTHGFAVPGTGKPALFVFAGENGDLSAWNQSVSSLTSAVHVAHTRGAVYKGLALVHSPFGPLVLATNFHAGRVDVFNRSFHRLHVGRLFRDRRLPHRYAPFGIATIGRRVYVSYARQDAAAHDDSAGPGRGFVDVYTTYGAFVRRLVSRGALNSPWGMVRAPSTFGRFAGALLVGNFGDGRIHAYRRSSGRLLGTLTRPHHRPLVIDGLWGLTRGDAAAGGPKTIWFSAGPDGEAHGLLGTLRAVPRAAVHPGG